MAFPGFDSTAPPTAVPQQLFTELLLQVDDLGELKLILYMLWQQERQEGPYPHMAREEIEADAAFMQALGGSPAGLDDALARAVRRGALLRGEAPGGPAVYMVNSTRGQAAMRGLAEGKWSPQDGQRTLAELEGARPNIFQLYEQNIGPLTPMLAEHLRTAEAEFPADWIEDAIRIALENNVRRWRYVEAILASWQEKGRDDRRDQENSQKNQRKYVEGEFSEFIER